MKIALVHDYLREYGGAERVLEVLHEMYPDAPVYTSFYDWGSMGTHAERFEGWDIRPSWVQKYWFIKKWISPLRFLSPKIWESFDLSGYDVVISSSGWFICRGVKAGRREQFTVNNLQLTVNNEKNFKKQLNVNSQKLKVQPLQICYIHHPPRNLYGYPTGSTYQKYAVVRLYASIINFFLRHYDYETAQKVDYFIANSKETARRVEKFYRRDSTVIYPPVTVNNLQLTVNKLTNVTNITTNENNNTIKEAYFLSVGRLAWSKQIDIIIEAANRLQIPLKIAGTGPEEKRLRDVAGLTVEFLGGVNDETLSELYRGAKATIFAALDEDFGIVPVESMAAGTPVIGLHQGGVAETVVDGKTGVLFNQPTVESLVEAIEKFNKTSMSHKTNKTYMNCKQQAEKFSKKRFVKEIERFVEEKIKSV